MSNHQSAIELIRALSGQASQILSNLKKFRVGKWIGIYFLYQGDKIVYVGQSKNVGNRVFYHVAAGGKIFSHAAVYDCSHLTQQKVNDLEAEFIIKLFPKYNRDIPGNNRYKSLGPILNEINKKEKVITRWGIKKIIKQKNISPVLTTPRTIWDIRDFQEFF